MNKNVDSFQVAEMMKIQARRRISRRKRMSVRLQSRVVTSAAPMKLQRKRISMRLVSRGLTIPRRLLLSNLTRLPMVLRMLLVNKT